MRGRGAARPWRQDRALRREQAYQALGRDLRSFSGPTRALGPRIQALGEESRHFAYFSGGEAARGERGGEGSPITGWFFLSFQRFWWLGVISFLFSLPLCSWP